MALVLGEQALEGVGLLVPLEVEGRPSRQALVADHLVQRVLGVEDLLVLLKVGDHLFLQGQGAVDLLFQQVLGLADLLVLQDQRAVGLLSHQVQRVLGMVDLLVLLEVGDRLFLQGQGAVGLLFQQVQQVQ